MDYRKVKHWATAAVVAMGVLLLLAIWYASGRPEIQPAITGVVKAYLVIVVVDGFFNLYCDRKSKK